MTTKARQETLALLPVRFCTRCIRIVAPERVAHGSTFCSNDCRNADKRERRAAKAGKACRLCGRRFRHRKVAEQPEENKTSSEPRATGAHESQNLLAGLENAEAAA